MTHPVLGALAIADQTHELVISKVLLEELLGHGVMLVAYPFGKLADVSPATFRLAARAGYQAAFTTMPLPVTRFAQRYALPRFTIHDWAEDDFIWRLHAFFGESLSR
jgi:peptidoglycan/xylan/chitin deacetylase (PgdA/CDA1 family)